MVGVGKGWVVEGQLLRCMSVCVCECGRGKGEGGSSCLTAAQLTCIVCNMGDAFRHADVFEDVFLAVYFGLMDLGIDVTKHRCDDMRAGCALAAADGGRQVWSLW